MLKVRTHLTGLLVILGLILPQVWLAPAMAGNEPVAQVSNTAIPDEPGWIAYVDEAISIMRPDGTQHRELAPAPEAGMWSDAGHLSWSHDGTMLAFNGPTNPGAALDATRGIWVYRDGLATQLPNTASCAYPAFSADNSRVLYTCWAANFSTPTEEQLRADPQMGFLSSSALDGSDQRVEISYADAPLSGTSWLADDGAYLQGEYVDVNPVDGSILVIYSGARGEAVAGGLHLDAALTVIADVPNIAHDRTLQIPHREFLPSGEMAIIEQCIDGCSNGTNTRITNTSGEELHLPRLAWAIWSYEEFSLSPDGQSAIGWAPLEGAYITSDVGLTGTFMNERKLAWQPVAVHVPDPVGPPVFADTGLAVQPDADSEAGKSAAAEIELATGEPMGAGRIAFTADVYVYTANPDGTDVQQVPLPVLPFDGYNDPAWSADGSMLAIAGPQLVSPDLIPHQGIWIVKDGEATMLPNTSHCLSPEFSLDGARVYYACVNLGAMDISPTDIAADPRLATVTSSAIDGSDQRAELTPLDTPPGGGDYLARDGELMWLRSLEVQPFDGSILVTLSGYDADGVEYAEAFLFTPDFEPMVRIPVPESEVLTFQGNGYTYFSMALKPLGFFLPDGSIGYQLECQPTCANGLQFMIVDEAGTPLDYPTIEQGLSDYLKFESAPDGSMIVTEYPSSSGLDIAVIDSSENVTVIGTGSMPAWQPVDPSG